MTSAALLFAIPPWVSIPILAALAVAASMHFIIGVILLGADAVPVFLPQQRGLKTRSVRTSIAPNANAQIRCVVASLMAEVANPNDATVMVLPNPVVDRDLQSIGKLPGLQWLVLDHTQITDEGLEHLRDLQTLRKIYIRGTHVSAEGLVRLKSALPRLTICSDHTHDETN